MAHLRCDSMFRCIDLEKAFETDAIVKENGLIYLRPESGTLLLLEWCPFCGSELKKELEDARKV